jgi:uroporphyrinogen decarboxylase
LTSPSRVLAAIRHEPGAPLARGELTLDRKFARDFLNWRKKDPAANSLADTDLIIACCRALQLDLVCLQPQGVAAEESDLLGKLSDIPRFTDEGLFVFWVVNGAFQSAMARRGTLELLKELAAAPDEVCKELRELSNQVSAALAQGVTAGAHGIIIADDIAYRQNTYISPDFVKQQLLPIWQTQVATARDLGVPVFFHSDGNLNGVLPTLVAAGFDGLQGIEPAAAMDLPKIKARYGQALCLMGNIDPALLSEQGRQVEAEPRYARLRRAVLDVTAAAGGDGGFIFGTCSGLHAGMSPELVQYMYALSAEPDTAVPAMSP